MRRHIEGELHDLEEYVEHHKKRFEAGDHHDPSPLRIVLRSESFRTRVFIMTITDLTQN